MYNYYYLKEYLPKRYSADIQQEQDREIVYAFKNVWGTERNVY